MFPATAQQTRLSGIQCKDIYMAAAHQDAKPFGLVVLDSQMPEMDGFMTAEIIRRHAEYAATKIVMATSSGNQGDGARCAKLQIQGYLFKPAKSSELFFTLCTVMETKSNTLETAPLLTRNSALETRKGLRILVADDNRVNQRLVLRLLEKLGHSIVLANNGREAGDVYARKCDRERCLEAGMDGYLSKPIQSQESYKLLDTVERLSGARGNEFGSILTPSK